MQRGECEIVHSHVNATLSKHALLSLITACIEVYKKETYGIILGEKHKKHYKVKDILAYQTAKRGYETVVVPGRQVSKVDYVLKYLTKDKVLGSFHSHPDFPDHLSGLDKFEIKNDVMPLHLLVLVKKSRKRKRWTFHPDYGVSGTVGSRYFIKLRAYENIFPCKHLCPIKIVSPFLRMMNNLEKLK